MRNIQIVSFVPTMVEAGFARIQPEEAVVIQEDNLTANFMQAYGRSIVTADMEGRVEHVGSEVQKSHVFFVEKNLGWIFPSSAVEPKKEERDGDQGEEGAAGGEEPGEEPSPAGDEGGGGEAPEETGEGGEAVPVEAGGGDEPQGSSEPGEEGEKGGEPEDVDVGPDAAEEPVTKGKKRGKGKKR